MVAVAVVMVATVEKDLPFTDGRTTLLRRRLDHLPTMTAVTQAPPLLLPVKELGLKLGPSMKSHVAFSRKKQTK
jgi:hypothetical protein